MTDKECELASLWYIYLPHLGLDFKGQYCVLWLSKETRAIRPSQFS